MKRFLILLLCVTAVLGCIDNIVLESSWEIVESGVGPEGHSDHIMMLWAEIKYGK